MPASLSTLPRDERNRRAVYSLLWLVLVNDLDDLGTEWFPGSPLGLTIDLVFILISLALIVRIVRLVTKET